MTETVTLLQQYGGWAVCVFLGLYYLKFYNDSKATIKAKDVQIQEINDKLHAQQTESHKEMVSVVRECTGILTTVNDSLVHLDEGKERRAARG